jgi:hypothetical protein
MGKGFNNYMCKKFFHPGSRDNLKRVSFAELLFLNSFALRDIVLENFSQSKDMLIIIYIKGFFIIIFPYFIIEKPPRTNNDV